MSIYYCCGDLLESNVDFICHQVNCQGKMGAGIAKSIRDKWPRVYSTYKDWCDGKFYDKITLGKIQIVDISDGKSVVNMAAQNYYGNHGRFTSYDAFYSCLEEIRNNVPAGSKIGFPYKIGCVRGGAKGINWNNYPTHLKRGSCCIKVQQEGEKRSKWIVDTEIPIFKGEGRKYIDDLIFI